jgi:hypothetical protein
MKRPKRILLFLPLVVVGGYLATTGSFVMDVQENGEEEVVGCVHYWNSDFDCPEYSSPNTAWFPVEAVDSIMVRVYVGQETHDMVFPIDATRRDASVDAVFFTRPAVDKFAMNYYRTIGRPGLANDLWARVPKRNP